MRKTLIALIAVVFAGIQLVPYGRSHANPVVRQEPAWDRPETRQLAKRACFDCHSNETIWLWYSGVAPVSWYTQRHVNEGRRKMNLSEWDRPQKEAKDAVEVVRKGEMPPWSYKLAHADARLNPTERDALIAGLQAMLRSHGDSTAAGRNGDEEHE